MISIRNAANAKVGLIDLCEAIEIRGTIVEIGSYVGDSTEIFARYFDKVIAIDPWENGYDDTDAASYQHDMAIIESQFDDLCVIHGNIEKIKAQSPSMAYDFDEKSIDVVYIDGLHNYHGVKSDIEAWLPKIKKGGVLCGHDYQGKFPGVIKAVDEFRKPDKTFKDTSWLIYL